MSQYTTLNEAKATAERVNQNVFIGGGVAPVTDDNSTSGIYIPEYTQGPFPTPKDGERKFYHFRFNAGMYGINVGLVQELMTRCPTSWPTSLAIDIQQAPRPL